MDTKGIEHITIGDLKEISEILKISFIEAEKILEEWIKENGLNKNQGQKALAISKKIFL